MNKKIIKKIYCRHVDELTENTKYFLYSLALSFYVFLAQLVVFDTPRQLLANIISASVLFLLSKASKLVFLIVCLISLLLNSVILHLAFHWGGSSLGNRMQAALLSPTHEMVEYLTTYVDLFDAAIFIYLSIGIYFIYLHFSKLHHTYKVTKFASFFLLAIIYLTASFTNNMQKMSPYKYISDLINANEWKNIVDKRIAYLGGLEDKNLTLPESSPQYDKIIIIMGESASRAQMSIYGYATPTTPFLEKLLKKENSLKLKNVIAPSNQTRFSVPISLTQATTNSFDDFMSSESIITKFKNYGYTTYWLSNQYLAGMHDSYIATIASEADYTKTANYVYETGGGADSEFDMILIDYLNELNVKNPNKEVYFLHLLGSHFKYEKRYPKGSGLFPHPENIVEIYDNTIHYTDAVLSEIFKKFEGTKSLFIYVSDHAEVVHLNKTGHGHVPTYSNEYDIPLIIHSSIHNNRLDVIKEENDKKLLNTESLNHLIQYLTGIEDDTSKISHSSKVIVLSPSKVIDYNKLKQYP